jgi:hypothetical protein
MQSAIQVPAHVASHFSNPNAGARSAELTKTDKYRDKGQVDQVYYSAEV